MHRTRTAALAAALLTLSTAALGATTARAGTGTVHYAALGDSYSAGGGSATSYLNSCNQSTNAYPYLYDRLASPATFAFRACGGATSSDVVNNQLGPLDSATTLVSITVGGNDVGLKNVLASCLLGDDATCLDAVSAAEDTARTQLPGELDAAYGAIRAHAPNAHVVVLGYPRFYDLAEPLCPGIDRVKRAALDEGADTLDAVIRTAAAEHPGFTYQEVNARFAGHQLCDSAPWLHALDWPVGQSFHPTAEGQANAYLPALLAAL
ncbi:SGNH/GDSL hydrolase family protein [Kitasatospora sp. NPDC088783]|uniref:SGNH/GDSL hydrolase family protein n=1 Tax=Kitasatospora sp. NPDC088783 TaxID=3364077 RepID=UPI003818D198